MDDIRRSTIIDWIERIEHSKRTINDFFKHNCVPFSKAQYFNYKKLIETAGSSGLQDRRKLGGRRKIIPEAESFILGCVKSNPDVKLEWLQKAVKENYNCHLSKSSICRAIKRVSHNQASLTKGRPKSSHVKDTVINPLGGFEIVVAIACNLCWPQRVADIISRKIDELKSSNEFKENVLKTDTEGRDTSGKFSKLYNQREDVRANRFAAISDKRQSKNWQSMDIIRDNSAVLLRKSLAILSLPVVTMNGSVRSVDLALGDALKHLCGFNYKQNTIVKYLSELKYLGVSTNLLKDLPEFWQKCWGEEQKDTTLLCYYIDGNTKAIWSSQRVKKNKVTMLGRVMGCLEQVFIHDGFGHPIYFETFSGHGPIGEHILGLFKKIEDTILEVPRSSTNVYRAIVMDAAGNSVKSLRAFAAQKQYYYITPLDDNQWNERKVIHYGRPERYRYGDATLRELDLELEDSTEKGYLIISRAIKIDWDNGKVTVLLTSLPLKVIDASEVVHSYFRRWPAQELEFKNKKAAVSLNRVAGYGRKLIEDTRVVDLQRKAEKRIKLLSQELEIPIREISIHEKEIDLLIPKERRIRAKSNIQDGKRTLKKDYQTQFDTYRNKIQYHCRQIKKIEKTHEKKFRLLRKHQKEWLRLQGKESVYKIDVELDQIVTFYRVSLANLLSYFIHHYLGGVSKSMVMILHQIIHLQAKIEEDDKIRKIELKRNEKDPDMMEKLSIALQKLNSLNIKGLSGKIMRFQIT